MHGEFRGGYVWRELEVTGLMILSGNSSQSPHSIQRDLFSYMIVGGFNADVCRESL